MYEEINAWIMAGRQYASGVQLYSRFGQSQSLKRLLERTEQSQANHETLVHELTLLLNIPKPVEHMSTHVVAARNAAIEDQPVIVFTDHVAVDRDLFNSLKMQMKVRDSLHASLSFEGQTDEQRRIIATKILDISNEISDGYDRHNQYLKHGVMPAAITKEVKSKAISLDALDKNQLLLRKIKITSHISHYKAYLKDPKKKHKAEHNAQCIAKWQDELVIIKKLLGS